LEFSSLKHHRWVVALGSTTGCQNREQNHLTYHNSYSVAFAPPNLPHPCKGLRRTHSARAQAFATLQHGANPGIEHNAIFEAETHLCQPSSFDGNALDRCYGTPKSTAVPSTLNGSLSENPCRKTGRTTCVGDWSFIDLGQPTRRAGAGLPFARAFIKKVATA